RIEDTLILRRAAQRRYPSTHFHAVLEDYVDERSRSASHTPIGCYTKLYHDFKISTSSSSSRKLSMWIPMLGLTALPHVGGIFGGLITRKEVKTWYTTLNKPSWRPPNAAFPVVWTTLYTGMGYASYLVWKELGGFTQDALVPLGLYGLQLALNWAWTPIFFGAHKIKLALMELLMLTGTVAATMVSWYPINRTATLLMVPYMAWLCLATSLNYCVWRDNPEPSKED
ncbi:hypothetical protein DNTS_020742, partial [Danionella cerebrum]